MKKRQGQNSIKEENYWETATDAMAGILFAVVLVAMLLLLYITQAKTDEGIDPYFGKYNESYETVVQNTNSGRYDETLRWYEPFTVPWPTQEQQHQGQGGSTEGGGSTEYPSERPTQPPTLPTEGLFDKSAVFVTVVDADSGKSIKEEGITFELYEGDIEANGLQTLYTYYPNKVEYNKFNTDASGTFYFPEKLNLGHYTLYNTKAPDGYYNNAKVDFAVEHPLDWSKPLKITVPLTPIRGSIAVNVVDNTTGEPIENAKLNVTAGRDIISVDGTVRFKRGALVEQIVTDEKGYAATGEMYYGSYLVANISAPKFYAVGAEQVDVEINDTSLATETLFTMRLKKTSCKVRLTDEKTGLPIFGAVYKQNNRSDLITNTSGEIYITNLTKSSTTVLTLSKIPDPYYTSNNMISITVDDKGWINGEPEAEIDVTAYTTSVSVMIEDTFFHQPVGGISIDLIDESGEVLYSWHSSNDEYILRDIKPGEYYLVIDGDNENRTRIVIRDTPEDQRIVSRMWATIDLFAILMIAGGLVLAILVIGFIVRRRRRLKNERR